jgi:very-short-patch-repair endonuclease
VVRFWNNDVLGNTDGVMLEIAETLRNKPLTPRPPLPVGEEENGLD